MYKILTLNNISVKGLERLPRASYEVASEIQHPDAIMLRSYKMHDMTIPESVKCIGRAGAGVNNIPVAKMSERGIPVFNAPGANANAVKELVFAGMLLAARNIVHAWDFTRKLEGDDATLSKLVEQGKKDYAGFELQGKTLGVIGLGAIGRSVANTAIHLGMNVIGFDPGITVKGAWLLSSQVQQAMSVDELVSKVDFLTIHVPYMEATKNLINRDRIKLMRKGVVVLNFARDGITDDGAIIEGIASGKIRSFVTDFPSGLLKGQSKVICLPHLGASTEEAEDNCAIMVADQIRDYLENGNIINSVNFPEVIMARNEGHRIAITNKNVPNMVGQITTQLANANLNIIDLLNKSQGEFAYTLIDVDRLVPVNVIAALRAISGVLTVRAIG